MFEIKIKRVTRRYPAMFSTTSGATEEGFLFCLHVYTD